jgi:hypothetical protein
MYDGIVQELIECIIENLDMKDGVSLLKDIIEKLENDPTKFRLDLKNALEDYCEENNFCKDCCEFAEPNTYNEPRPYGDTYVNEERCEMVCLECGKVI